MSSVRQRLLKTLVHPVQRKPSKYNVEGRRTALSFPLQSSVAQVQKNGLDSGGDDEDNCGLSIEQISALKEQFDAADIDGGGSLDLCEVKIKSSLFLCADKGLFNNTSAVCIFFVFAVY
jgi:hypothetical protein